MKYKIHMSKGEAILITEEELVKIKSNIKAPFIELLNNKIINPSFIVSINRLDEGVFDLPEL